MNKEPRIVILNGEINEYSAMNVILNLLYFDRRAEGEEINLYINSNGGSVTYGLAIYDTIKNIKSPVSTICYGVAASMGAFLLTCGQKGERCALPHSRILIHQPLIYTRQGMVRSQTAMQREADGILKTRKELERIIAENVGRSEEEVHADCERDNWMSAEEALRYGIIDKILGTENLKKEGV